MRGVNEQLSITYQYECKFADYSHSVAEGTYPNFDVLVGKAPLRVSLICLVFTVTIILFWRY